MAKKRGPIGKVEAFYIENNYKHLDIAELATDLDRPISSVEKYIKTQIVKPTTTNALKAGDQFVRQSGATIMTENASTISDSRRKPSPKNTNCITKIKK